jgi:hypothetical protein
MSLPASATHVCDIYRSNRFPPDLPDVVGVPCILRGRFGNLKATIAYSHVALFDEAVDVRWHTATGATPGDQLYFPDKTALTTNGARYRVVQVQSVGHGTAFAHKVAYLQIDVVQYPTSET